MFLCSDRHNCHELSQLQEDCAQLREQEKENRQLSALNREAQSQLSVLTQELANEKLHSRHGPKRWQG
ncbi:hypothetical protein SKAU_G00369530 [Synaphobranchus kaupii]|uniref:Uncharacterized protein n=1 Tax=Synaphobranchus kaupii TaxID=118154 RepID=A0A9Q1EFR5_SYNKA|nr:hypothetical protein SKAU_G00369530 [Synaphobranchus kaupii]